ncbi:MAG TPA: chemotaxis protein CheD [Terriglobales bacterium]|nr:chemotaxis protein CheD [Terriglobales bacterium]
MGQAARTRIFLLQGQIYCQRQPALVSTILGSCVSLCLWDPKAGFGGINHYVLPGSGAAAEAENTRYGELAIDLLHRRMLQLGADSGALQAKIFGGASVFPLGASQTTVGTRNVELAIACMNDLGVPIIEQETGGDVGRQLVFDTGSGKVTARIIGQATSPDKASPAVRGAR